MTESDVFARQLKVLGGVRADLDTRMADCRARLEGFERASALLTRRIDIVYQLELLDSLLKQDQPIDYINHPLIPRSVYEDIIEKGYVWNENMEMNEFVVNALGGDIQRGNK